MKLLLVLLISLTTQMALCSDFTDWASGIAEELGSLGSEVRGCTGSTTTAFQSEEDIRECEGIDYALPDANLNRNLSLEELSKYAWIESKLEGFLEQLSESYKNTYELYQYTTHGVSKDRNTAGKAQDVYDHFEDLFYAHVTHQSYDQAFEELNCSNPRSGSWVSRRDICDDLMTKRTSSLLNYNRLLSYSKYPFLKDPILQNLIDSGTFPDRGLLEQRVQQAINNQFDRIKQKQREVIEMLASPQKIAQFASATPGLNSNLTGEEWAMLNYLVNGVESSDLAVGESRFIHARCLFHEDLLNHQKISGWGSLKKNVLLTAVSLGAGGVALKIGKSAAMSARASAALGAGVAFGTSGVGIALIDLPELNEIYERCEVTKELLLLTQQGAEEYLRKERELQTCERELSMAVLFTAISPVADIISTATVAGRLYFSSNLREQMATQARAARSTRQTSSPSQAARAPSSAQAPRAPVRAKPPPPTPRQLRQQFFSRSTRVNNAVRSPEEFAERYNISLEQASEFIGLRDQAISNVNQTIFSRRSSAQQPLTRDSLTRSGFNQYKTIEEYNKVTFPEVGARPMTVSDLISEVTYDLGGETSRAGRRFRALSSAMDNYSELKAWHQDLFDSSLDFLLRSGNEEWVDNFNRTGRIPREVTESVLLERAQLYGWGGEFTDLEGGILPPRDFGRSIASGNYIRERDLDAIARRDADNGDLVPGVAERVQSGEFTHGDLTHAAQMDYLLFLSSQGRLDNIKPEQLKDIIAGYGQGIVRGTPGKASAWGALFDQDARGTTLRTPNVFYSVFGRDLNL